MTDLRWRKSSFSDPDGACVEIAATADGVLVRNSNRPEAGTLPLTREQLAGLIRMAREGGLDDLT